MRRVARVLLVLLCAGLSLVVCRKAAPPIEQRASLWAGLSADTAGLGDPILLRITAVLPVKVKPILPGDSDSLGPWKILRRGPVRSRRDGDWVRFEREIEVAAYRLGRVGPDTLAAWGVLPAGDSLHLRYAPPPLIVKGRLPAGEPVDPGKARDIRDVVSTGPVVWPWFVGVGIVIIGAAVFAWRRLRSRAGKQAGVLVPPGPTPEDEFRRAIDLLLASGLLEQGLYREFYYRVSGAVRLYLEKVHGLPLLESTSSEVLSLLRSRLPGKDEMAALREWLAEGDLVKYARMERLQVEAREYLDRSLALVRFLAESRQAAEAGGVSGPRGETETLAKQVVPSPASASGRGSGGEIP